MIPLSLKSLRLTPKLLTHTVWTSQIGFGKGNLIDRPVISVSKDFASHRTCSYFGASLMAQLVKNPPAMRET